MAFSVEKWVGFGSAMAGFGLLWSRMHKHVHDEARHIISSLVPMVMSYFNPYEQITISEYGEERFEWNKMFFAVSTYREWCAWIMQASSRPSSATTARMTRLSVWTRTKRSSTISMSPHVVEAVPQIRQEQGAHRHQLVARDSDDEPRCYRLVFHKRHRKLVLDSYLPKDRPRSEEYHSKVGKAWKRGYLLHGPPGTGKSTMIGAMANFLEYDVYDLDLTSIKDNAELRKLFLDTTDRSIIVIEDIDAIEVELTTKRKGKEAAKENDDNHLVIELSEKNNKGKVTLSGLLSFVDGLWSACGSERIFVFTTNHVDRLDPALIRRGRMDRHIEMSYCRFEAFKMLAKSYLDITEHSLFGEIGQLLDEIDTTPADVADNLMPRGKRNGEIDRLLDEMNGAPADVAGNLMLRVKRREADDCLAGLVETLKKAKMKAAAPPMDSVEEAKEE
ncbi:unnamed protein product [Miscanthus lutarioriparius]|uniref:AAA+ ATPase domain-containing protein n=1 Tax=Miscanthus lutarioriparius TaxID=422564 RepID=A0A811QJQ6_9POAL|nr:unnamed protein product [Miscanthus lutarioriparius]